MPSGSTFQLNFLMMQMKIAFVLIVIASLMSPLLGYEFSPEIPYPRPYPDSVAVRFLPGLVSVDGLDFNSTFSPDGRSFFFSRSYNGQWDILVSEYMGNSWSNPVCVPFSDEKNSEADPMFSPDGRLFFISNKTREGQKTKTNFDIWYVERIGEKNWSEPRNLTEVNSDSSEYYVSFAKNGDLYFGSSRPGGYGSHDIYISRLVNGVYKRPENLGAKINTPNSEHDPCLSADERLIVFKSEEREDGFGQADLYYSTLNENGHWTQAKNFGPSVNTEGYEYCPYFTPDGRFFFFSSRDDVMWMDMREIKRVVGY